MFKKGNHMKHLTDEQLKSLLLATKVMKKLGWKRSDTVAVINTGTGKKYRLTVKEFNKRQSR
jgi:hypothetical protein